MTTPSAWSTYHLNDSYAPWPPLLPKEVHGVQHGVHLFGDGFGFIVTDCKLLAGEVSAEFLLSKGAEPDVWFFNHPLR